MRLNFCTLFDKNYLDRGLLLYESLCNHADSFCLYIIAMDKTTFEYLNKRQSDNLIVIDEQELLDEEIAEIKRTRSKAEYCWMCSSVGTKYCMERFSLDNCTYVDSDVFFFANPRELIDEMIENECSVQIVPHRFKRSLENYIISKTYGKYCVEFNTFLNDDEGKRVLNWWIDRCKETCSISGKNGTYGDQKYLDRFHTISKRVNVLANPFAGVAPWNFGQYKLNNIDDDSWEVVYNGDVSSKLIFYHFQNLKIIDKSTYNCDVYSWNANRCDSDLLHIVYDEYVRRLIHIREELERNQIVKKSSTEKEIVKAKQHTKEKVGLRMKVNETAIFILSFLRKKKYANKNIIQVK